MTDRPDNNTNREEREPYVPASPVKRIMAWVGIVYMVGFVILNIYPFFNQGNYLTGIAPLFACPGIAGIFAISVYLPRTRTAPIPEKYPWPFWRCSVPWASW